jgi:hypothetical protein
MLNGLCEPQIGSATESGGQERAEVVAFELPVWVNESSRTVRARVRAGRLFSGRATTVACTRVTSLRLDQLRGKRTGPGPVRLPRSTVPRSPQGGPVNSWRGTRVVAGELCRRRVTGGAGVPGIGRVLTQGTSEGSVARGGQLRRQQRARRSAAFGQLRTLAGTAFRRPFRQSVTPLGARSWHCARTRPTTGSARCASIR